MGKCMMKTRLLLLLLLVPVVQAADLMEPTTLDDLDYALPLLTDDYNPGIATPEQILGFEVGKRTATPEQIVQAIRLWSQQSDKAMLVEYARSHEDRPLYYVVVSSPANLARLDDIKADLARLADAASTSSEQADEIIGRLPAIAWMAYSIHGNESSGADASLAALYHLIASNSAEVSDLLEKEIVIIDPSMNPDGRARFVKQLEQARGTAPNIDNQSVLHSGVWPYGRTNHYLFDLNRDFVYLVHPETRGRVRAINEWTPQLMIDGHEMGSLNTYLFAPAREPINAHVSRELRNWNDVFARDQAAAFDRMNWPYYTGEWFENLYAGYSNYSEYRGSIHILYEQASTDEDAVMRPEGRMRTYQQSVHQQLVSTLVNLETLARHSADIYRDYFADRQRMISSSSPYASVSYVIEPTDNHSRLNALVEVLQFQDINVYQTSSEITVSNARDHLGQTRSRTTLPAGSVVIPNRQAEARLIAAVLEFDTPIKDEVLIEERQNTLRDGSSIMYDVTAWNLSMMYGLSALRVPTEIKSSLVPYQKRMPSEPSLSETAIAWAVDGADDRSLAFAARLMEQGVQVRVIDKESQLDDRNFSRGSILVSRNDNRKRADLVDTLKAEASGLSLTLYPVSRGLGEGELPDIGGRHFRLLRQPSIAIISRGMFNFYDYGTIWHSIDTNLGIRHSHLDQTTFSFNDLRRYNVLILPDRFAGNLSPGEVAALKRWVEMGNTLIAVDGSVPDLIKEDNKLSAVRSLEDSFGDIADYDISLQREWLATRETLSNLSTTRQHAAALSVDYPSAKASKGKSEDDLKQVNRWQSLFMPSGAFVAGRGDQKHWLSFGTDPVMPLLVSDNPVLMSGDSTRAVVRIGDYRELSDGEWDDVKDSLDDSDSYSIGWSTLPQKQELLIRMSGLLWPEASQRLANSAWLTQERKGQGQIILFASQPNFRGAAKGMNRFLLNAIVLGPGLGTSTRIEL